MKVKSESEVAQSCQTLSDPMDCSLPGSSIHGICQARVLEWGAIAFSSEKGIEKASDIDTRRGQRVPHSLVWVGLYILFQLVTNNRKVLPDPLPQLKS